VKAAEVRAELEGVQDDLDRLRDRIRREGVTEEDAEVEAWGLPFIPRWRPTFVARLDDAVGVARVAVGNALEAARS
jgi:hypothetical protein